MTMAVNSFGHNPTWRDSAPEKSWLAQYQNHSTGLLPSSGNVPPITSVRLNQLGAARVRDYFIKNKLQMPVLDIAPDGQEYETPAHLLTSAGRSNKFSIFNASIRRPLLLSQVDNTTSPYTARFFPPIGNQGSLNTCVSFAYAYYGLSFERAQDLGITISNGDPANIFSPAFLYPLVNKGTDNGQTESDVHRALQNAGVPSLAEWQYNDCTDSNDSSCYQKWPTEPGVWRDALKQRVDNFKPIPL